MLCGAGEWTAETRSSWMLWKLFGSLSAVPPLPSPNYSSSDNGNVSPSAGCFRHPRFLRGEVHFHCAMWVHMHPQAALLGSTWHRPRLALSPSGPWNMPSRFLHTLLSLACHRQLFWGDISRFLVPTNCRRHDWSFKSDPLKLSKHEKDLSSPIISLGSGKDWNSHSGEILHKVKPPSFFLSIFFNLLYSQSRWQNTRITELDPSHLGRVPQGSLPYIHFIYNLHIYYILVPKSELGF